MSSESKHLVIVRTGGSIINLDSYNCQELGLAKALTARDWRVTLILAGEVSATRIFDCKGGIVEVRFLKFKKINQALSWFEGIEELLASLKPDIIQIHEFGMLMSYRVTRWAKRNHVPTVLIQGSYRTTRKPVFRQLEMLFNQTIGKYILKNVDGIGCKSLMAEKYVKSYVDRNCRHTFIGLDIEKFSQREDKDWRSKLEIKEDAKILLYVGTLEQRRNPLFLIDIMALLPNNYVLIIVGDGLLTAETRDAIQSKRLSQRVKMLGKLNQEQLPCLYKMSDLFLLASDYEIYGMVILEAMYFGTPVVSSFNAGSEVLIEDNSDGVLLSNKDAKEWSNAIQQICSDATAHKAMKDKASLKISQSLIWSQAAIPFEQLYTTVLPRRK